MKTLITLAILTGVISEISWAGIEREEFNSSAVKLPQSLGGKVSVKGLAVTGKVHCQVKSKNGTKQFYGFDTCKKHINDKGYIPSSQISKKELFTKSDLTCMNESLKRVSTQAQASSNTKIINNKNITKVVLVYTKVQKDRWGKAEGKVNFKDGVELLQIQEYSKSPTGYYALRVRAHRNTDGSCSMPSTVAINAGYIRMQTLLASQNYRPTRNIASVSKAKVKKE